MKGELKTEKDGLNFVKSSLRKMYGDNLIWLGKTLDKYQTEFDKHFGDEWKKNMGKTIPDSCFILKKENDFALGIVEIEFRSPMSCRKLVSYYDLLCYLEDFSDLHGIRRDFLLYTLGNGKNLELRDISLCFMAKNNPDDL